MRATTTVATAATAGFVLLAAWVQLGPTWFDVQLHGWVLTHRSTSSISLAKTVTAGGSIVFVPTVFIGGLLLSAGRAWRRISIACAVTASIGRLRPHRPPTPEPGRLGGTRARVRIPFRAHHDRDPPRRRVRLRVDETPSRQGSQDCGAVPRRRIWRRGRLVASMARCALAHRCDRWLASRRQLVGDAATGGGERCFPPWLGIGRRSADHLSALEAARN